MRLFLLRHAEAVNTSPDPTRPLTRKGHEDVRKLGEFLRARGDFEVGAVLHSPYLRARETAEGFIRSVGLRSGSVAVAQTITPMDDPVLILPTLLAAEHDLLLVGHNPHLSRLAALLLSGHSGGCEVEFKKCALMALERQRFGSDRDASWSLSWFITPKLFR